MEFKDYYATLGVPKTASDAEIKKVYRKLARQLHPDVNPGDKTAEAKFKDVNEANEVLGDSEKRRKYDELGANWRQYEQNPGNGQPGPPGDWHFGGGSGGGGTYRTMTPDEMRDMFGADDPFSDFFHTFFSGGGSGGRTASGRGGRRTHRPARGHDVEHPLDLTLEEAFSGATRRLMMSHQGKDRSVDVRIPAGVRDHARVRAAGEGGPGSGGGSAGDLYLRVHVLPHDRFERKGQDLHTRVDVPATTAVLGGEVSVPTLGGSSLRLKVPPLTTRGRIFRLRGHGMPTVGKPDERGDLYAAVDIQTPSQITDEERGLYEQLQRLERQKT